MPKKSIVRLNKEDLGSFLSPLLVAYSHALKFIQTFPSPLARREVIIFNFKGGTLNNLTPEVKKDVLASRKKKYKLIFRVLVNVLVEIHIQTKLTEILRVLKIAKHETKQSRQTKQLEKFVIEIEQLLSAISGRNAISGLFSSPYISVFTGLLAPILVSLVGVNIISPSGFGELFVKTFQAQGWSGILKVILVFVTLAALAYIVLTPVVVSCFQVKRAIFSGGNAESEIFDYPIYDRRTIMIWLDFPSENIYHLENSLYHHLGIWKKLEFPYDYVFNISVYFSFFVAIFLTFYVVSGWALNLKISTSGIIMFGLFWFLTVSYIMSGIKNYRFRKLDENL